MVPLSFIPYSVLRMNFFVFGRKNTKRNEILLTDWENSFDGFVVYSLVLFVNSRCDTAMTINTIFICCRVDCHIGAHTVYTHKHERRTRRQFSFSVNKSAAVTNYLLSYSVEQYFFLTVDCTSVYRTHVYETTSANRIENFDVISQRSHVVVEL